jgi:hypothetical protein
LNTVARRNGLWEISPKKRRLVQKHFFAQLNVIKAALPSQGNNEMGLFSRTNVPRQHHSIQPTLPSATLAPVVDDDGGRLMITMIALLSCCEDKALSGGDDFIVPTGCSICTSKKSV